MAKFRKLVAIDLDINDLPFAAVGLVIKIILALSLSIFSIDFKLVLMILMTEGVFHLIHPWVQHMG